MHLRVHTPAPHKTTGALPCGELGKSGKHYTVDWDFWDRIRPPRMGKILIQPDPAPLSITTQQPSFSTGTPVHLLWKGALRSQDAPAVAVPHLLLVYKTRRGSPLLLFLHLTCESTHSQTLPCRPFSFPHDTGSTARSRARNRGRPWGPSSPSSSPPARPTSTSSSTTSGRR